MGAVKGAGAFETFTDEDFWPWAALFGGLAMLLGFIVSFCLRKLIIKPVHPKYQAVEAVKLVYEGEEEDEVVLQSGGGSMMSVSATGGPMGPMSSWQPSKASTKAAMTSMGRNARSPNNKS